MRNVYAFFTISLDGYFEGPNHDLSWHHVDEEFNEFAVEMLENNGAQLFGRRTYELMSGFWPHYKPETDQPSDAGVAALMNSVPKIVFSKTLNSVDWDGSTDNIRLATGDLSEEVTKLKQQPGGGLWAGGSNLCVSLLELGLLDEVWLMVNPVVIGNGTPLFHGIKQPVNLNLTSHREFKNGNVLLKYRVGSLLSNVSGL